MVLTAMDMTPRFSPGEAAELLMDADVRKESIELLLARLSSDEWRDLCRRLSARTFTCDIFGTLPTELQIHIARQLDPQDLIRCRRVSRRWTQILRSPDVCQAAIAFFFPGEDSDVRSQGSSQQALQRKSRRLDAFQRFRPYGILNLTLSKTPRPDRSTAAIARVMSYFDGFLAWIDRSYAADTLIPANDVLTVRDLRSGRMSHLRPKNRELLCACTVSDSIVAAISTLGICYAFEHNAGQEKSFRLPVACDGYLTSRGLLIAVARERRNIRTIYVMNFDLERLSCVNVDPAVAICRADPPFLADAGLSKFLIHPSGTSLLLVNIRNLCQGLEECPDCHGPVGFGIWQEKLDGLPNNAGEKRGESKAWVIEDLEQSRPDWAPPFVRKDWIQPCSFDGRFIIMRSWTDYAQGNRYLRQDFSLQYDSKADELSRHSERVENRSEELTSHRPNRFDMTLGWRDTVYQSRESAGMDQCDVIEVTNCGPKTGGMDRTIDYRYLKPKGVESAVPQIQFLPQNDNRLPTTWLSGDERYVVHVRDACQAVVYCFDREVSASWQDSMWVEDGATMMWGPAEEEHRR